MGTDFGRQFPYNLCDFFASNLGWRVSMFRAPIWPQCNASPPLTLTRSCSLSLSLSPSLPHSHSHFHSHRLSLSLTLTLTLTPTVLRDHKTVKARFWTWLEPISVRTSLISSKLFHPPSSPLRRVVSAQVSINCFWRDNRLIAFGATID